MRKLASLLFIMCFLVGCTAEPSSKVKPTTIKLTPVDLFQGSGEKFKPFLGSMSGAFKLRYEGTKPNAQLDIDIWENGEKASSSGSVGDLFFSTDELAASDDIEIIISIEEVSLQNEETFKQIKINVMHNSGYSFFTLTTPWDEKYGLQGLLQHSRPMTFQANESIHVFGLHATSTNGIRTGDLSPESLARIEKAIIFTLHVEP